MTEHLQFLRASGDGGSMLFCSTDSSKASNIHFSAIYKKEKLKPPRFAWTITDIITINVVFLNIIFDIKKKKTQSLQL